MKTLKLFVTGVGISLMGSMLACQSQSSNTAVQEEGTAMAIGDQSRNALDWPGHYIGELPCADCPGIKTALVLSEEGQYELQMLYIDRGDQVYIESGSFEWNEEGNIITLSNGGSKYLVSENQLYALDGDGNRIEGDLSDHFRLAKAEVGLTDVYWKLIELNGNSITAIKTMREPYMRINTKENRVEASGGCNGMGGNYELKDDNWGIKFSQFISTQMACENMEIEQQFGQMIERVDSYVITNDTLQLNRARMAPFAKFKAIYVK